MKHIFIMIFLTMELFSSIIQSSIQTVDNETEVATINIEKINIGMSGFIIHKISKDHSVILKSVVVTKFDESSNIATLKMSDFTDLDNDKLPNGRWKVQQRDIVVMAFGYSRGLLIAPSSSIYRKITKRAEDIRWIHPDRFATLLSFVGHPTPLKEDIVRFSVDNLVGLVFIYLDEKLFTVDARTLKILSIGEAPFAQNSTQLPFYTRLEEIDANWWGEGSDELTEYAPHYYKLLKEANPNNKELQKGLK